MIARIIVTTICACFVSSASVAYSQCSPGNRVVATLLKPTDVATLVDRSPFQVPVKAGQGLCSQDRLIAVENEIVYHLDCLDQQTLAIGEQTILPKRGNVILRCLSGGLFSGFLRKERAATAEHLITRNTEQFDFAIAGLKSGEAIVAAPKTSFTIPILAPIQTELNVELAVPDGEILSKTQVSEGLTSFNFENVPLQIGDWKIKVSTEARVIYGQFSVSDQGIQTTMLERDQLLGVACEDLPVNGFDILQRFPNEDQDAALELLHYWSTSRGMSLCAPD